MTPASGFCGLLAAAGHTLHVDLLGAVPALVWSQDGLLRFAAWASPNGQGRLALFDAGGAAFHGELYNRPDLCCQLGLPEDTMLLPLLRAGWQAWGEALLPRLDGVFALAMRDGDSLVLYRDASGLRNLYAYTGRDGQIAFATHLDTLLHLPGTERRLARRSVHEYLRFLDIAAPNTLFEDVIAVEAGQVLRWSAQGMESRMLAAPQADAPAPASFAAAVDALDAYLQRSVQTRLAGAERPAAFLSGGIDSALLCAMAACHRGDMTAITVGFEGHEYDESPVAQRIAAHLGLKHEVLRFGRQDFLSAFERLARRMEQPMADPATPATLLAFEHCHNRFDAVLDGTGADEAVGMMPPRHVRLAVAWASLLPRNARGGLIRLLRATPGAAGFTPIFDFEHPADTMIRWNGFTRSEIEDLCGEPVSFGHSQFYRTFDRHPRHAHFERYSALLNAMPSDRLNQAMLLSGTTVRYPFFAADTDHFIRQLRTDHRYLPGQPKRILRALLARYVPAPVWDLPKHGFNFPLNDFLGANDFALVRRHLDANRWARTGILSGEKVAQVARRFIAGDRRLTFRVWALAVLGAWLDEHGEWH